MTDNELTKLERSRKSYSDTVRTDSERYLREAYINNLLDADHQLIADSCALRTQQAARAALVKELRQEAEESRRGRGDYFDGKAVAYDDAADRIEKLGSH